MFARKTWVRVIENDLKLEKMHWIHFWWGNSNSHFLLCFKSSKNIICWM